MLRNRVNVDNVVNNVWWEVVCFFILVVVIDVELLVFIFGLIGVVLREFRDEILVLFRVVVLESDGGGVYLNEVYVDDLNWWEVFYGGYYE